MAEKTRRNKGGAGRRLAAFSVTDKGHALALRLRRRFKGLAVFSPAELKDGGLLKKTGVAFERFNGLIFICASGIAVRAVAPHLKGKHLDPAVVVVDERGSFAISLLSGHLGGANDLAREIASLLKAAPVITTATDGAGLPCVEDMAGRFSLAIENVKEIKSVNAAILKGASVAVVDRDARRLRAMKRAFGASGAFTFSAGSAPGLTPKKDMPAFVLVSNSAHPAMPEWAHGKTLILRPREFAVGIGCKRGVVEGDISGAVKGAFDAAGLSMRCIRNIATIDLKSDEAGLTAFAKGLNLPVEFFKNSDLKKIRPPSGPSSAAAEAVGCPAVAEPAALLSAKAKRLWIKKYKSDGVTVAAARVSSRW